FIYFQSEDAIRTFHMTGAQTCALTISAAIINLKDRNGSSRQAVKKYIQSTYKIESNPSSDSHFNQALKRGVRNGDFLQPKGPAEIGRATCREVVYVIFA